MGTVGVPKNMAQLAAVMTLQQSAASPGGVGVSSGHNRIGPNDSLPLSRLEDSGSRDTGAYRSMQPESAVGLAASSVLLRSGSDSTGRGNLRSQGLSFKGSAQTQESTQTTRKMKADDLDALTPLQRMQQQLQMGQFQSMQQQQQQSRRYHFGYPQSFDEGSHSGTNTSSSLSSSGTRSGLNSNNSSQLELQSTEQEFHAAERTSASAKAGNRRFQRIGLARSDSTGTSSQFGGSSIVIDECEENENEDSEENNERLAFDQEGSEDDEEEDDEGHSERARPVLSVVGHGVESESDEAHSRGDGNSSGILSGSVTSDSLLDRSYNSSSISLSDPREEEVILVQGEGSLPASSPEADGRGTPSPATLNQTSTSTSTASFVLEEEDGDAEPAPSQPASPLLSALEVASPSSMDFASPSLDTVQEQVEPADEEELSTTGPPSSLMPHAELATTAGSLHVLLEVEEVDEDGEEEVEAATVVQGIIKSDEANSRPILDQSKKKKTDPMEMDPTSTTGSGS
ncbi:hypothetical protein MVEG_11079 [Podila verticillata NRRL 6337]|uniref:Uncharacterized protein n=1 Tax=Podila verticillata NRRL 6337 TaxID=1069443 RepID=A0A086TM65_9FUNG|nr:hypothetical protein MVEG_11079 [Podila verticillata NRRL 6337]